MKGLVFYSRVIAFSILCFFVIKYSFVAIKNYKELKEISESSHNRLLSGFQVFKNAPNYRYSAYNAQQENVELNADSNGFFYVPLIPDIAKQYKDTLTILLCGGSALMGSGQVSLYSNIHYYPNNLCSYDVSVAGQLHKELELMYPNTYFKVVNTSSFTRTFYQSFLMYITKLSGFKPDLIIQMDGFNDLSSFITNDIYESFENTWLNYYVEMRNIKLAFDSGVLNILPYIFKEKKKSNITYKVYHPGYANQQEYNKRRDRYLNKSINFLNIVKQYSAVLKEDNVPFIFSIQPMLHNSTNKKLSETEERFRKEVNFFEEAKLDRFLDLEDEFSNCKDECFKDEMLLLNYAWSDFISDRIEDITNEKGGGFIDFNVEASKLLDDNFELYTDFCHLTLDGNQFIAKVLANKINQMKLFSDDKF